MQEELESINFNKWPMASRGSPWGSFSASSRALTPISRAWGKQRGHRSCHEFGSSQGAAEIPAPLPSRAVLEQSQAPGARCRG